MRKKIRIILLKIIHYKILKMINCKMKFYKVIHCKIKKILLTNLLI